MNWWHAKDHPVWRLAEFAVVGLVIAFTGSESLDAKDYAAVLAAIFYGRVRSSS